MNRMIKRLLAAVLITSMLLGSNGISYAAEIADGDSIAGTEEVTKEAVDEEQVESPGDAEASEPASEESAEEEQIQEEAGEGQEADAQTVEEAGAEASEEENTAAEEEISEAASEEEAVEPEDEDAAVTEEAAAAEDAEAPENADAAAAELTAEEAAAAAAAAQAQEEVFTAGELVYHGHDYDVTLAYDENAKIPAAAELKVREIEKGTSEYESYLAGAEAAAGKGVAEARFFDITIVAAGTDGQQQEIQPQSQVRVNITYHKALEVAAEGEVQAMHFEDGTADAEVVNTDTNGGSEVSEIAFNAESFSVYGIVYTVDFTYDGFTYCIEGGSSIYLSELAQILGLYETDLDKAFSVGNVSNVTFTDYELVKIEKQAGDWLLTSLAPFSSEETLTITMNDGVKFVIGVTDEQNVQESTDLSNFLTNIVVTGATQNAQGAYEVEAGKEYAMIASFAENDMYQFDNDGTLTYSMPDGIEVLSEQSGPLEINVVYKGRTYQVDALYHLGTDGNLTINFDQNDPDYPKLVSATNVSFRFSYHASFDGTENHIIFSDSVVRDIVFDEPEPGQAYVSKSAVFDENTGKFTYKVTVTADGNVTNVNVKDVISGNALTFNNDVLVTGNSSDYTDNGATNGFDYTFMSMNEGETITISYTADVIFSNDDDNDGKITADQTKNTVTVEPDDGDPHTSEYSREIDFKSTKKSDGTETGTTEDGDKIIEWKIDYNQLSLASAAGDTITDKISQASQYYMKYYGDGITVEVYDHNGTLVDTRNVPYSSLTEHSDSSWKYTIPDSDTEPYYYKITYQTVVDMEKVDGGGTAVTLNNTANGDEGGAHVSPVNQVDITKDVVSSDTEEVTWVSTISVPEGGLDEAVVTDTLPAIGSSEVGIQGPYYRLIDLYEDGSLEITGLLQGETYVVDSSSDPEKVIITFYKDAAGTTGLQATPGGHTIIVKLTTKVNQDWLEKAYDLGPTAYQLNHKNTISINGKEDTAEVIFPKPGMEKTCNVTKDANGKPVSFEYVITLKGVNSAPISVEDVFDTSLLEVDASMFVPDNNKRQMYIYGSNQYLNNLFKPTPISYSETSNGLLLTANSVPMQDSGEFYSHYKIFYKLKLKDGVDLDQLAIANEGKFDLINTAKWNGYESEFTYKTEYEFLNKELLNLGELGPNNRMAKYQITFNSAKATLNEGEPMEMKDTLSSNLSVDYGSITITTDPAGVSVPYSLSGGPEDTTIATYMVPDSTKVVITYDAMVIGYNLQQIVNKVEVNGKEDIVDEKKDFGSASEGSAEVASFKVVKVDGYDANKKLEGVQFKLFGIRNSDGARMPLGYTDEERTDPVYEKVLTTDENGEIILDGEDNDFYFDTVTYHLQEVAPPPEYGSISFDYKVTLTNNMALVDYGKYVYYYSDSMQIKNWPLEGLVVEKKVESDDEADQDAYYNFRISILKDDDTVDTGYNEKNGDDQFENGVAEFELKAGEQKMFWGFDKGTKYRVEEVLTDDQGQKFTTTVGYDVFDVDGNVTDHKTENGISHSGELTQEDEIILFTNKKETAGALKLTKEVTVNGAEPGTDADKALVDGNYTFTIKGPGSDGTVSKTVVITVTNGKAESAKVGETETALTDGYAVIGGLTPGEYTITEAVPKNGTKISKINGEDATGYSTTVTVVAGDTAAAKASAAFTNDIGYGSLKITKNVTVNGETTTGTEADGTYEFSIVDSEETAAKKIDGTEVGKIRITITNGAAVTTEVTRLAPGDYTITETEPTNGTSPVDGNSRTVTVVAGNSGDYVVDAGIGTFTNNKGLGALKLTKEVTVNGAEPGTDADKALVDGNYTFTIKGPGSDGTVSKTVVITVTNGKAESAKVGETETALTDGYAVIGGLTPGEYTITEAVPKNGTKISKINGTATTEYSTTVTVVAGDTAAAQASATFTNNYETTEIEVDKKWVNADGSDTWPDGVTVDIQLTADDVPVSGKTATLNKDKPSHKFEKLPKYDSNGNEIAYSVKESKVPGYSGFAEAVADGKITITNTQGATQIEVEKKWVNADGTDTWPTGVTVEIQLTADGTEVSGKTATLSAEKPSHKFEDLPMYRADGKTDIEYSVKELKVSGYTSKVGETITGRITVTNTQETTEVVVDKKWVNADGTDTWPTGVTVEIQLTADGTEVSGKTATLSAENPSHKFENLPKYDSNGNEIVYSVEEPTKIAGYTSSVEKKEAGKFTVTNAYSATGTLNLEAEKKFKNGKLKEGEFTFELMDADGKVLQSKTNDAAGKVAFDEIEYKLADAAKAPFTYTVREVPGSRADVKYDATVYTVTVELKDKGDGTLEVTKKIDNGGALKFENEQLNVETSVTIGGVKQLKGQTLKKDQFKFVLADENGKWLDTATNDAEGNFIFKPITYKLSDLNGEKTKVYSYSVWEVKGSESGITYDKTVYTVKVTVTDNGDGTMTAKADKAKSDIKFVNTTTEKKSKKTSSSKGSKTGDEAPLGVLFGGLGVGAIGLAVLLWNRKKKKDEE